MSLDVGLEHPNITCAKVVTSRLKILGMIETSYSRAKAVGYMPLHTRIFVGVNGNTSLADGVDVSLRSIGFTSIKLPQIDDNTPNVRFTGYCNAHMVNIVVHHSQEGEVLSITLQYVAD